MALDGPSFREIPQAGCLLLFFLFSPLSFFLCCLFFCDLKGVGLANAVGGAGHDGPLAIVGQPLARPQVPWQKQKEKKRNQTVINLLLSTFFNFKKKKDRRTTCNRRAER